MSLSSWRKSGKRQTGADWTIQLYTEGPGYRFGPESKSQGILGSDQSDWSLVRAGVLSRTAPGSQEAEVKHSLLINYSEVESTVWWPGPDNAKHAIRDEKRHVHAITETTRTGDINSALPKKCRDGNHENIINVVMLLIDICHSLCDLEQNLST